jgi:hypothetical protein
LLLSSGGICELFASADLALHTAFTFISGSPANAGGVTRSSSTANDIEVRIISDSSCSEARVIERLEAHNYGPTEGTSSAAVSLSLWRLVTGVDDQFFFGQKLERAVPFHIDGVSKIAVVRREHGNNDAAFMVVGRSIDLIANRKL